MKKSGWAKAGFSLAALGVIALRIEWPTVVPDDRITLALMVVATLPWFVSLLESFEGPGGWKLKFKEVKEEQERQRHEIEMLRFLLSHFVTDYELQHLTKLKSDEPFYFERRPQFIEELLRLRAIGLINNRPGQGIRSLPSWGDLHQFFFITNRGREYLELRAADTN